MTFGSFMKGLASVLTNPVAQAAESMIPGGTVPGLIVHSITNAVATEQAVVGASSNTDKAIAASQGAWQTVAASLQAEVDPADQQELAAIVSAQTALFERMHALETKLATSVKKATA